MWEHSSRQAWVVPRVSKRLGQNTNRTCLSNPSLTTYMYHVTHMHRGMKPQRRNLLSGMKSVYYSPSSYSNTMPRVAEGGHTQARLDNLGQAIWSRFSLDFPMIWAKTYSPCSTSSECELHLSGVACHWRGSTNHLIYTIIDHFQLSQPIWKQWQSHCSPSLIAVDTGNLIHKSCRLGKWL